MQTSTVDEEYEFGYSYPLGESEGQHYDDGFSPDLTPEQMLRLRIFGGDYFNSVPDEFPAE